MLTPEQWAELRDRVKNGYGWDQVTLTPEQFLFLMDNIEVLEALREQRLDSLVERLKEKRAVVDLVQKETNMYEWSPTYYGLYHVMNVKSHIVATVIKRATRVETQLTDLHLPHPFTDQRAADKCFSGASTSVVLKAMDYMEHLLHTTYQGTEFR
jgi:hypothetical protein